jgi:hypothetical protein
MVLTVTRNTKPIYEDALGTVGPHRPSSLEGDWRDLPSVSGGD